MKNKKGIALVSGGLDSLLTVFILKEQNIPLICVTFITPFFGWKYKKNPQEFEEKFLSLGVEKVKIVDITEEFIEILKNPKYGYGSYANPCIDCKILMLKKAKEIMEKESAQFIVTGEVVGQRPFSQNKNTLELIEKKAGVSGILLRPLSAKLLSPTLPEIQGWVNREKLFDIYGRRRIPQIELAKKFGIKDIPSPSGGCLLTDPVIGERVLKVLKENRPLNPKIAELLVIGRHIFEKDFWIVVGRNQKENELLCEITNGYFPCYTLNFPSPLLCVIQGTPSSEYLFSVLLKYSKKARNALAKNEEVKLEEVRGEKFN